MNDLHAPFLPLAPDFASKGCEWPEVARWRIPSDLPSGFYLLIARAENERGEMREQEHGIFVLPARGTARAPLLLVGATSTWIAYNDWGGSCSYVADRQPQGLTIEPNLSILKPWARGFIALPDGAPRKLHDHAVGPGEIPRYPQFEFALNRGYSRYYANAGWACYERVFAHWAEREGYALDFACQHDLHFEPDLLDGYACVVLVGHDEYWSREMRQAVDRYLARGGKVARFAGNFFWQIRLEDGGRTQVSYNRLARTHDPVMGTDRQHLLTAGWEDPLVGWPGAKTFGLNGSWGIYANFGSLVPRGPGGFTIYRPEHWSLAGTGLCYGDVLGGAARIFGYEVDGLDHEMVDGLPYPRGVAAEATEIIGMGLAYNVETAHGFRGEVTYLPDETGMLAICRYGEDTPANRERARRGNGMMVTCRVDRGEVFHAGTIDWVAGLLRRDAAVEQVTRNVLDRFTRGGA